MYYRQVADQFDFTLIKTMFQKIDGVLKKLNLGQDATQLVDYCCG